ncbi:hypothetical protein ACJVC5_05100 [Peredibacter sp. HCB2-198]|uniref:hypothetical protein n=1 Tax=Peredibacter sp. HCB2-198 TaxID=3383025 RepID=UPI0038B51FB3
MKEMLRLFYAFKLIILVLYGMDFVLHMTGGNPEWLWPVRWFQFFRNADSLVYFVGLLGLIFGVQVIRSPFDPKMKAGEFIFSFLFFAAFFSYGKIDHSLHGLILSSIFLSFINGEEKNDQLAHRSAVSVFVFTYFLSGLWKLRIVIESSIDGILTFQLARNMVIQGENNSLALSIMNMPMSLQSLIWVFVIVFELAGIFVVQKQQLIRAWGILLILFHAVTYFVMGVSFWEAQVVALILMVLGPASHYLLKPNFTSKI